MRTFLPNLDQISFLLGLITGLLLYWVLTRIRPVISYFRQRAKEGFTSAQTRLTVSGEDRFRSDMLRFAQKQHLAASFAALDDILIEPKVIAPPNKFDPDREQFFLNTAHQILPYLPDFPELLSTYHYPALRLAEAMQEGANLILMGDPGSGKTVALAHLTSLIARRQESVGVLRDYLPLLVHAADLELPLKEPGAVVSCLVDAVLSHLSPMTLPNLSGLLRERIQTGNLLLMVDGLDELPFAWTDLVHGFLQSILVLSPNLRIIVAASLDYYGELPSLGLIPVAMSAWNKDDQAELLRLWLASWNRLPLDKSNPDHPLIDSRLAEGWLRNLPQESKPIEYTLRIWAALCGDTFGMSTKAVTEAHIRRLIEQLPSVSPILSQLAYDTILHQNGLLSIAQIENALTEISAGIQIPDERLQEPNTSSDAAAPIQQDPVPPARKLMNKLIESGLWVERSRDRLQFRHLYFAAVLAGNYPLFDLNSDFTFTQVPWTGATLAMSFASFNKNIDAYISFLTSRPTSALKQNWVDSAKMLRFSNPDSSWRTEVLRNLVGELQNQENSFSMKAKLISALAKSRENGIPALLRRFFAHPSGELRMLAALGSGLIGDKKAINELVNLALDPDMKVRQAACLALGTFEDPAALEQVALLLIRGDDQVKRAAAEMLAHHPGDGHETLKDGATYKDLRVRRAVIYGLAELNQPWALDTLQEMQINDDQWIVQSTAEQTRNLLTQPNKLIPKPYPALDQTPWIVEFAAEAGHGVQDEEAALALLGSILRQGDQDLCLAALDRLRFVALLSDQLIQDAAPKLKSSDASIRDTAYSVFWHLERGAAFPRSLNGYN